MYDKSKQLSDRREMLRVKSKSLAEEARIIRREERRTWGPLLLELHHHRVYNVRIEARMTHIAYALIKGRTLEQIEKPGKRAESAYNQKLFWDKVRKMIDKYGPTDNAANCALLAACDAAQHEAIARANAAAKKESRRATHGEEQIAA